jgi:hypothetical protein
MLLRDFIHFHNVLTKKVKTIIILVVSYYKRIVGGEVKARMMRSSRPFLAKLGDPLSKTKY